MDFIKATDTEGAIQACKPFPLVEPGDSRYVDFSEQHGLCRGGRNRLVEALKPAGADPGYHMVLAGPGGNGKSTLVLQSFDKFRANGLYPVHIDVLDMLDPGNIQYSDLLLTLVACVGKTIGNDSSLGIDVAKSTIDEVAGWFKDKVLSEEHVKELAFDLQAGAKGSYGIPLIGSLFAKVTAAFQGGSKYREEIRQSIDKKPSELTEKVNMFLDAVTESLRGASGGYREILVFFDNLEKIYQPSRQVDQALINKASLFRQIRCKALYTIPFGLLLNPGESGLVSNAFDLNVIPMVSLRDRNDPPERLDPARKGALAQIIARRLDMQAIFESDVAVDAIIRNSGGCPRDLLSIIRLACEYAGEGRVGEDAVESALNRARVEHLRPVKGDDFAILARVHRDKYIQNTADEFRLLYHRLLVHYNDTEWYDAHPLVQRDPRFVNEHKQLSGR